MSDIKPALTPKEWAEGGFRPGYLGNVSRTENELSITCPDNREIFDAEGMAKLAALCLHDQPFGFTREDVELLREWFASREHLDQIQGYMGRVASLADRIEALLPPETDRA